MKSFKEVEATRIAYHHDGAVNSVHRSSLLVPELEGARAEVSFLNHFLLKRGYQDVGCRVTAVGPDGRRVESRLLAIDEPRVYTLALSGTFDADVSGYLIEFFTGQNLFIPFPAVMVNHVGDNYLNTVHAYNRVLNDVFEDDAINGSMVEEASIDIALQENTDTFVVFIKNIPCFHVGVINDRTHVATKVRTLYSFPVFGQLAQGRGVRRKGFPRRQ